MDILNIQRYDSSNEEEDDNEKENERASLKKKRKNDYKYYKKKKKIKINNNCFITSLYIFIYTLIAFILIFFILKLRAGSSFPFSGKNKNLNLRKIDKENNSKIESIKIFNKSEQSDLIMTENINIIEDIKKPTGQDSDLVGFLTITAEHHATVVTRDIWGCEVLTRILVGDHRLFSVGHRVK